MKKLLLSVLLLLFTVIACAQDVLTNQSIINLSKVGLSSSIIINKIKSSKCSFDLSTDALVALKEGKVNDDVIGAMLDKKSSGSETGNPRVDSIISRMEQSGIYFYNPQNSTYTRVDPTLVTGNKTTMGLTGTMKSKSEIDGPEANLQTNTAPVFYFYFGKGYESKLSNTGASSSEPKNEFVAMMQAYMPSKSNEAFSPNDFKLIKLDRTRKTRYFESGKISAYTGTVSSDISKNVQGFKYEAITSNLYRVYFPTGLPEGEYCFIYATSASANGVAASRYSNPMYKNDIKVFDFGVKTR
jgi:hypothetical protein